MNLKLLLLHGLTVFLWVNSNKATFSNEKTNSSLGALEMWTKVGEKATGLSSNHDLKAAFALIVALGKAIPYAGPLAILVSGILGMDSNSELMGKLKSMNAKLDKLDSQIIEVLNQIESVLIIAGCKSKIEQVINLKLAYERFTANPTNDTRDDFKAQCGSNKMMAFVGWIESEDIVETLLVMLDDFDMRNFNYWSNQITALLSNAIFLHSTCLGVSGYNEATINETLYGTNGDIEIFKKVLKNVKKGFNQGVKFIKRSFFSYARQEVKNFIKNHTDLGHQEFADKLYEMLSSKYYWRLWGVVNYESFLYFLGEDSEGFEANGWYWNGKRTVIVGSVLPDKSNTIYKKLEEDIESCRGATEKNVLINETNPVVNVRDILKSCNIEAQAVIPFIFKLYKAVSVEFSGFYQRGVYNPRTIDLNNFTASDVMNSNVDAHVIAIPHDCSPTITNGEICSPTLDFCSGDQHCCPENEKTNQYFCCPDTTSCGENGCE